MKVKYNALLACSLMMLLLNACEQQTSSSAAASGSSRITVDTATHEVNSGNYIIHVNALSTSQLPTEIARGYNISRSKNRAMMNVAVREKQSEGERPITADVKVLAKNLSNQIKNVSLREIKEDDPLAIYYIGELPVSNEEIITFNLDVTPAGASEPVLLTYRQQFFTE